MPHADETQPIFCHRPKDGAGRLVAVVLALWLQAFSSPSATPIPVPNGSFEFPQTLFVDTRIDDWQHSPTPAWYHEDGGFLWSQLTGLFKNTAPGSFDHITNLDGSQGVWLFAIPEVALFQELSSDTTSDPATVGVSSRFRIGKAYALSVGVIGAGGGMSNGVTLEISLYYKDANGRRIPVTTAAVTNDRVFFADRTFLQDVNVSTATVRREDPWAGQPIGIQCLSTVDAQLQGGYWDLDAVRLIELDPPTLSGIVRQDGGFELTVRSEPGQLLELLTSPDPSLPLAAWTRLGSVTNTDGTAAFIDASSPLPFSGRFYQARLWR